MREYKCLSKQTYSFNEYRIVPIRDEDRYNIMQWRNDQIYHLRQSKLLDRESQDNYFNNIISNFFEKEDPEQILFSYLKNFQPQTVIDPFNLKGYVFLAQTIKINSKIYSRYGKPLMV